MSCSLFARLRPPPQSTAAVISSELCKAHASFFSLSLKGTRLSPTPLFSQLKGRCVHFRDRENATVDRGGGRSLNRCLKGGSSQGQHLASTVLRVPNSLDSGPGRFESQTCMPAAPFSDNRKARPSSAERFSRLNGTRACPQCAELWAELEKERGLPAH